VEFGTSVLETRRGPRTALMVTPSRDIRVGRERLRELRVAPDGGSLDEQIWRSATKHADASIMVMRGRNDDGSGSWGFDEELTDEETTELGELLVRSQVPTYRRLIAAGMLALIHVEFGFREVAALRNATAVVRDELERRSQSELEKAPPAAAVHALDVWILRHLTFFFSVSFDKVASDTLPEMLPLIEQRAAHLEELVAALPPGIV